MMRKLSTLVLFALLLLPVAAVAQKDSGSMAKNDQQARKERILANLTLKFPPLAQAKVVMGDIEPSGFAGLDHGSFQINGQTQQFLVSQDDKKLFLIAGEPIDVSHSKDEIEAEQAKMAADREKELAQAIQGMPVRGNADAPVTIVEFSDFECPYCERGFKTVEQILDKYPNDVKFIYKHFPLVQIHPWAKSAAIAAVCATEQDPKAFWKLHDSFFENQKQINPGNVMDKAKGFLADAGIDMDKWSTCATDDSSEAHKAAEKTVDESIKTGQSLGVQGTPGFFVNGKFVNGAQPLSAFEPLIEQAKAAAGKGMDSGKSMDSGKGSK
jgi:protein-disulfide isomerase